MPDIQYVCMPGTIMLAQLVFEGPVHTTGKKPQLNRTEPQKNRTVSCSLGLSEIKNRLKPHATESVRTGSNRFLVALKNVYILSLFLRETGQICMFYGQNDMLRQNPTLCDILYLCFFDF